MTVDPNIQQKADYIRTKKQGSEVRESLASGLEAMSEDVVNNTERQDTVESQFQQVIENTTDKDVISAPEIIAARKGEPTLDARITKQHQEVTAQLAQTFRYKTAIYGAVGNNQADDTQALNDLFSEAQTEKVTLEPGKTYRVTETILINADKVKGVDLNWSRIIMDSTVSKPVIHVVGGMTSSMTANPGSLSENIFNKEKDFLIEKGRITSTDPTKHTAILVENTISANVDCIGAYRIGRGLEYKGRNRNANITGCQIYAIHTDGILLNGGDFHQLNVSHNHISYCRDCFNVNDTALYNLQMTGNDIEVGGYPSSVNSVLNFNSVNNIMENIEITGNTIEDHWVCDKMVRLNAAIAGNINVVTITGNSIGNAADIAVQTRNVDGLTVTGNTFKRSNGCVFEFVSRVENTVISSNTFVSEKSIMKSAGLVVIRGLKFVNNSVNNITGIFADIACSDIFGLSIKDNFIFYRNQSYNLSKHVINIEASNIIEITHIMQNQIKLRASITKGINVSAASSAKGFIAKENIIQTAPDTTELYQFSMGTSPEVVLIENNLRTG